MPKALAKALAVPLEIAPKTISVLIKAPATAETVPSPPEAITTSAPRSMARSANSAPPTSLAVNRTSSSNSGSKWLLMSIKSCSEFP